MPSDAIAGSTKWDLFAEVETGPELVPDPERRNAFQLWISGTPHSYVDLDAPTDLQYECARQIGHMIDLAAGPGAPLRMLHLGAGALMLSRYVAATRPGSEQEAVDLDQEMLDLVGRELPLPSGAHVALRAGDAREELGRAPEGGFDMVVTDVFAGPRVPKHMTTVEFVGLSKRALRPGGVHAMNLADGVPGGGDLLVTRRQLATAARHFAHLALMIHPDILRGRRIGNLVLLASDDPLPVDGLAARTAADPFGNHVMHGRELAEFQGDAEPVTDAEVAA